MLKKYLLEMDVPILIILLSVSYFIFERLLIGTSNDGLFPFFMSSTTSLPSFFRFFFASSFFIFIFFYLFLHKFNFSFLYYLLKAFYYLFSFHISQFLKRLCKLRYVSLKQFSSHLCIFPFCFLSHVDGKSSSCILYRQFYFFQYLIIVCNGLLAF